MLFIFPGIMLLLFILTISLRPEKGDKYMTNKMAKIVLALCLLSGLISSFIEAIIAHFMR